MKFTPEYASWANMRHRCNNSNVRNYYLYGGRGIRVCERWNSFSNFYEDMGPRPDGFSLDRIDSNGNYEPSNCKWSSRWEQNNNRSINRIVEFRGEKMSLGRAYVLANATASYSAVSSRVSKGWDLEKALTTPKLSAEEIRARQVASGKISRKKRLIAGS